MAMIAYLIGTVIYKQAPMVILCVNGIGYEVWVPMSTFYNLPEKNLPVELYCYHYIKEDTNTLYGFLDMIQRRLFATLIKTSGVGPRLALTIMSNYQVNEFMTIIERNDSGALERLPGVGAKTAQRLLLELKDKLNKVFKLEERITIKSSFNSQSNSQSNSHTKNQTGVFNPDLESDITSEITGTNIIVADAIAALEALGYKYNDVYKMIMKLASNNTEKVSLTSEYLIKEALKQFK